jgi:two-component system, NarL family, nitrate/nitrite response regulator NarL
VEVHGHTGCPIRVAIVDDHPIARWGMERLFEPEADVDVVCAVASFEEFRACADPSHVVILDLHLNHGKLTAAQIAEATRRCPALVVSASGRRNDVLSAIRAGASGYLIKSAEVSAFVEAIRTVAAGGFYISSQLADLLDSGPRDGSGAPPIGLAPREREALSLIAQGFTQAQAATRMGVSPATIDTYIKRIRRKLGPGNKADLTRRAIELGEVDAEP